MLIEIIKKIDDIAIIGNLTGQAKKR